MPIAIAALESEIATLVEMIWNTVLETEPVRIAAPVTHTPEDAVLTGCIQITGAWEGAVVLTCAVGVAERAAARMFQLDPSAAQLSDLKDALGELTNMCGGNIKGCLPGPSYLSLPTVVSGTDHKVRIPGTRELCRLEYESDGDGFAISVLGLADSKTS